MTDTDLLHTIPAHDWEATPSSVRTLLLNLLPLATEVAELRARVQEKEQASDRERGAQPAELSEQRLRIERYQSLVDRFFLNGLSSEEEQELNRLGSEIDARNAPFFETALRRMEEAVRGQK